MSAYQQYELWQSSSGCTSASWGNCIDNIFVEIKDFNNAVFPACHIIGVFNPFQNVTCYKKEKKIVFKKELNAFSVTMPHDEGILFNNILTFSIDGKI